MGRWARDFIDIVVRICLILIIAFSVSVFAIYGVGLDLTLLEATLWGMAGAGLAHFFNMESLGD